jgi:hypothetical protein
VTPRAALEEAGRILDEWSRGDLSDRAAVAHLRGQLAKVGGV